MSGMEMVGMGAAFGVKRGAAAVALALGLEPAPCSDSEAAPNLLPAFKRQTQQRYVDPSVNFGLIALDDAVKAARNGAAAPAESARTGLLLATAAGPAATRQQYLDSYVNRGKSSVSATLFSNCGYNIIGAMLARSQDIRGPVLTFGADAPWGLRLAAAARRMFAAGRVDQLYVGRVEAEGAVMIALTPSAAGLSSANPRLFDEAGGLRLDQSGATPPLLAAADDRLLWRLAALWADGPGKGRA